MPVLQKSRHEQFAQLVARGETAGKAYASLYGEARGADQSASRLLRNAQISARIAELRSEVAEVLLGETILDRQNRLKAAENRWLLLNQAREARAAEHRALAQLVSLVDLQLKVVPAERFDEWCKANPVLALGIRNTEYAIAHLAESLPPGGETGWVLRDYRGKNADRVIFKEDTALAAELRAIEESVARQLGQLAGEAGGAGITVPVQVNVVFG
jgi:hypothetical protein